MRLFIAVEFDSHVHEALGEIAHHVRSHAKSGKFVEKENYHLTLAFLGERDESDIEDLKNILDGIQANPLPLRFERIGTFDPPRPGRIYWVGIEPNRNLTNLHKQLVSDLEDAGYELDRKPFRPHVTLARRVHVPDTQRQRISEQFTPFSTIVKRISLMESQRGEKGPIYKALHTKRLEG